MEEIVVAVQEKLIPQERVQQRTVEYVSAPQLRKEAVGVVLPRLKELTALAPSTMKITRNHTGGCSTRETEEYLVGMDWTIFLQF